MIDRGEFAGLPLSYGDDAVPVDGASAIGLVQREVASEGGYLALCWPAFWWMDYYRELERYLDAHARLVTRSEDLLVYQLQAGSAKIEADPITALASDVGGIGSSGRLRADG